MKEAGRRREARVLRSSRKFEVLGGSETRPTWRLRMKKVLKNRAAGEVVRSQSKMRAIAVTTKSGQRESVGHCA